MYVQEAYDTGSGSRYVCCVSTPLSSSSKLGTGNISQQRDRQLDRIANVRGRGDHYGQQPAKHRNTYIYRFNLCATAVSRGTKRRLLLRFTIIIDATATSFRIGRKCPGDT